MKYGIIYTADYVMSAIEIRNMAPNFHVRESMLKSYRPSTGQYILS